MIDKYQRMMFRFCGIDPVRFWEYTLTETIQMLEEGRDKLQDDLDFQIQLHTDLKVSILNSPHSQKKGGGLYKIDDFLKKSKTKYNQVSESDKNKRWLAAGHAMMNAVEPHQKIVKCKR